ncbi:MAG: hypothetical protein M0P71_00955 [Melioribacteraceae bacterium]|nr:hypothetical protein [Melioribacteraceae bacterium]
MIDFETARRLKELGFDFKSGKAWITDSSGVEVISYPELEDNENEEKFFIPSVTELIKTLPPFINVHDRYYKLVISLHVTGEKPDKHIYARYEMNMGYGKTPASLCGFPSDQCLEEQLANLLIYIKEHGWI